MLPPENPPVQIPDQKKCPTCGNFIARSVYSRHCIRKHNGDGTYKKGENTTAARTACKHCGKYFATSGMSRHIKRCKENEQRNRGSRESSVHRAMADEEPVNSAIQENPLSFEYLNNEQQALFKDERVTSILQQFQTVQGHETFYGRLAKVGIHILINGQPAQTGPTSQTRDYEVGDSKTLKRKIKEGSLGLFVLRDKEWFEERPSSYGSSYVRDLMAIGGRQLTIDVQMLDTTITQASRSLKTLPIQEVVERLSVAGRSSDGPINLLSLRNKQDGTVPMPIAKSFRLLNDAVEHASGRAIQVLNQFTPANKLASAGKEKVETIYIHNRFIDLESCLHFRILGQAGAISGWHIDAIGPWTYATLELDTPGGKATDVLKLWAVVRTNHLEKETRQNILDEFAKRGEEFMPPKELIRVISLIAGDTLIMPPGTIHAPITITNCLFTGGMAMEEKSLRSSLEAWEFVLEHDITTNEDLPQQSRVITDYLRTLVIQGPSRYGYKGEEGINTFLKCINNIAKRCMACTCVSGCSTKRCKCMAYAQRCGPACHSNRTTEDQDQKLYCENPFGCEITQNTLLSGVEFSRRF